jgi:hypothetical protein
MIITIGHPYASAVSPLDRRSILAMKLAVPIPLIMTVSPFDGGTALAMTLTIKPPLARITRKDLYFIARIHDSCTS